MCTMIQTILVFAQRAHTRREEALRRAQECINNHRKTGRGGYLKLAAACLNAAKHHEKTHDEWVSLARETRKQTYGESK